MTKHYLYKYVNALEELEKQYEIDYDQQVKRLDTGSLHYRFIKNGLDQMKQDIHNLKKSIEENMNTFYE